MIIEGHQIKSFQFSSFILPSLFQWKHGAPRKSLIRLSRPGSNNYYTLERSQENSKQAEKHTVTLTPLQLQRRNQTKGGHTPKPRVRPARAGLSPLNLHRHTALRPGHQSTAPHHHRKPHCLLHHRTHPPLLLVCQASRQTSTRGSDLDRSDSCQDHAGLTTQQAQQLWADVLAQFNSRPGRQPQQITRPKSILICH